MYQICCSTKIDDLKKCTAALKQENSYYAFGMQMAGGYAPTTTTPNKKLYNAGREWQDDIDGLADYYSTFFREYDPVIGRFNGVDPMSASFESWTSYHYSYNNPVNFNDPMGDLPTETLAEQMQREYREWHGPRYGNGFFDRGWDLGGGGDDGMGGNGGGGTYAQLKADLDYFGTEQYKIDMYNQEKSKYFWGLMNKWKKDGAEPGLYYFDEVSETGVHYSYDQSNGPLFTSADAAAIFWGNSIFEKGTKELKEYSAQMYWITAGNKTLYGLTETVRFTEYWEPDPFGRSPGPDHKKHSQPPKDAYLYAHLHLHPFGTSKFPNEDFSRGPNLDQDVMTNSRLSNFYLITPTGRVLHNNPEGGNSRYLGQLIGNNRFVFYRSEYPKGFDFTQYRY